MKRLLLTISMLCSMGCVPTAHAQDRAKPKNGEGVSTFLQRFGYTSRAAQKEFLEINKGKLTRDGGLILGRSYRLPTGKKSGKKARAGSRKTSVEEPLFGPAYQNVSVRSHELEGACLYLVSGHGGPDPGAIGKVGNRELHEDEYAYDIILRLGRALMEKGAKVHIIIQDEKDGIRDDRYLSNSDRETCLGQTIPLDQIARLQQRCDAINRLTARGMYFFDYGNAFLLEASRAGAAVMGEGGRFRYPSYVQDIMGPMFFDYGFGPFRWVCTSGRAEDLDTTDRLAAEVLEEMLRTAPDDIR